MRAKANKAWIGIAAAVVLALAGVWTFTHFHDKMPWGKGKSSVESGAIEPATTTTGVSPVASTSGQVESAPPASVVALPAPTPTPTVAQPPPMEPDNLSPLVKDVVKLTKAQMSEDNILAYVRQHPPSKRMTADELLYLKNQGISHNVIKALMSGTASNPPITNPSSTGLNTATASAVAAASPATPIEQSDAVTSSNDKAVDFFWFNDEEGWYKMVTKGITMKEDGGLIPFLYSSEAKATHDFMGCSPSEEQEFYSRRDRPFFLNCGYDYLAFYKTQKNFYGVPEDEQIHECVYGLFKNQFGDYRGATNWIQQRLAANTPNEFEQQRLLAKRKAASANLWRNARTVTPESDVVLQISLGNDLRYDFDRHGFLIPFGNTAKTRSGKELGYRQFSKISSTGNFPSEFLVLLQNWKIQAPEALFKMEEVEGEKIIS
ncbi:MAG: hypothetical protein ABSA83_10490 [Verrucomicrobiota bacterium]|jgi:hypothetical protein